MRCADCGVEVEVDDRRPGQVFSRHGGGGRSYVCRIEWAPNRPDVCVGVDYHYLAGGEQRHFRADPPPDPRPVGEDPDIPPSELPTRYDYEWLAELDAERDIGVPCPAS